MEGVDPRDAAAVTARLVEWATGRFGAPVAPVAPPSSAGAGFDSYIHMVHLDGDALPAGWTGPLVVRILPTADRADGAHRAAAVQGWCADRGFPAPRVLHVFDPGELLDLPVQVMERAPGEVMLDAVKRRPWRTGAVLDRLAELQLRLHALDTTGWPIAAEVSALADVRLSLPRRAVGILDDRPLADAVERAEEVVASMPSGAPPVVCHGDFHPLNVLVDGERTTVIDWSDAGLGPREAEVSRTLLLFEVASVAARNAFERAVLRRAGPRMARRFRERYESVIRLDERTLRRWEALHALHGWSQVAMLHAGAFDGESSSAGSERRVPLELADWLRLRFNEAAAPL